MRSLAIRTAKTALEREGFSLPEPLYRVRLAEGASQLAGAAAATKRKDDDAARPSAHATRGPALGEPADEVLDTSPDTHLEEMVQQERSQTADADLLDRARPVE